VLVQVDVLDGETGELGEAQAGVDEQAQDGLVATVDERLPDAAANSARSWAGLSTGTGFSGTRGSRILAIGLGPGSSPSSSNQPKSCCSARKRTDAVDGERVSIRCVTKSATWSRVTASMSVVRCSAASQAANYVPDSTYVSMVRGARFRCLNDRFHGATRSLVNSSIPTFKQPRPDTL
jgi:hypothetical protein